MDLVKKGWEKLFTHSFFSFGFAFYVKINKKSSTNKGYGACGWGLRGLVLSSKGERLSLKKLFI